MNLVVFVSFLSTEKGESHPHWLENYGIVFYNVFIILQYLDLISEFNSNLLRFWLVSSQELNESRAELLDRIQFLKQVGSKI